MSFKKALLAGVALFGMSAIPAQASIIDNPHFKVLGVVIVWSGDSSGNPIATDFVIGAGANGTDLIGSGNDGRTVVTGTLTQTADSIGGPAVFSLSDVTSGGAFTDNGTSGVLDVADTFAAFGMDETTDVSVGGTTLNSSFYVASNTGFVVNAQAANVTPLADQGDFDLTDVSFSFSNTLVDANLTDVGTAARIPAGTDATGLTTLDDLTGANGVDIYSFTEGTAASRGSIMEQSIRLDWTYKLGGDDGYDLSMGAGEVEAEVVYTVFVP